MNLLSNKKVPPSDRAWRHVLWNIAGQLVMGMAIYFLVVRLISSPIPDLRYMDLDLVIGALFLNLVMLLLMSLGWTCALHAVGVPMSLRSGFALYYRVSILRYIPGSIWNFPGRAYLCQQRGIPLTTFTKSAFFELYFLLTIAGALAGWGISIYLGNPGLLLLSSVTTGVLLLAIILLFPRFSALLRKILGLARAETLSSRPMAAMIVIYAAVWISYGVAMAFLLLALPGTPSFNPLFVIPMSTTAWVAGFLSPSPVGIGVRELCFSVMLGSGFESAVVVASLIQRVLELGLEGVLWLVAQVSDIRVSDSVLVSKVLQCTRKRGC